MGLIDKAGSWYTAGEEKIQGWENMYGYLMENPAIVDNLKNQIKGMLQ